MNNQHHTVANQNGPVNNAHAPDAFLPHDTSQALNMLIRLTNNLSRLADRETQALAQNDMMSFAILQDEKALVTEQYMKASEEFRSNIKKSITSSTTRRIRSNGINIK